MEDGVYRYTSEDGTLNMAILKEGETYHLYEYDGKDISRALTVQDVNRILKQFWTSGQTTAAKDVQSTRQTDTAKQAAELDAIARKKIPDYAKLSAPNQSMIRKVLREARASGISAEDALLYAKVSAHTGVDVVFDKASAQIGTKKDGTPMYADSFYAPSQNRIVF